MKKKERTLTQKCMYFALLYKKGIIDKETYNNKINEIKQQKRV